MHKLLLIMAMLVGLSGCATMESAWDSTKEGANDAYEWAFSDEDNKSK